MAASQIFAVVLSQAYPEVERRLKAKYPGAHHYQHGDRTFLVKVAPGVMTRQVAMEVGLGKDADEKPVGMGAVLKLNGAYAGWEKPELWEWLSAAMEDVA